MASSSSESVRFLVTSAFNGPPIIGIGGSTDQGLTSDQHHAVPYAVKELAYVSVDSHTMVSRLAPDGGATEFPDNMVAPASAYPWVIRGTRQEEYIRDTVERYTDEHGDEQVRTVKAKSYRLVKDAVLTAADFNEVPMQSTRKAVDYNVEKVLGFPALVGQFSITDADFIAHVKADVRGILAMMLTYNLYLGECRDCRRVPAYESYTGFVQSTEWDALFTADAINRALTFIAARVHTKYQTNHSMGGSVAQGAMASCIRAYYSLSRGRHEAEEDKRKYDFLYKCLYWALHPVNEAYMMVQILARHRLNGFPINRDGAAPELFTLAEHLQIRSTITAAGTHHFAAGIAGVQRLRDFGLLSFLPNPGRLVTLMSGFRQAQFYAAQCHPAANFWKVPRVTLTQRSVEDIVADIGYAIRILFPGDSLASAPAFEKEAGLSMAWKTFIDGVKSQMDKSVAETVKPETMQRVLPSLTAGSEAFAPIAIRLLLDSNLDEIMDEGTVKQSVLDEVNSATRL
jgi:hypothetical protein